MTTDIGILAYIFAKMLYTFIQTFVYRKGNICFFFRPDVWTFPIASSFRTTMGLGAWRSRTWLKLCTRRASQYISMTGTG